MSMFSLVGYRDKIQPIALKMGLLGVPLEPHILWSGDDWNEGKVKFVREFMPDRRRSKGRSVVLSAPHTRAYDGGKENDQSKAIEYAEWLAKRDKIKLPKKCDAPVVEFEQVSLEAYKTDMIRAKCVHFGKVVIHIPHVHYDPTKTPRAY